MEKKGDLSDFEHDMVIGDIRADLSISERSYWDFHTQPFLGFTEGGPKRGKHPVSSRYMDESALLI